MLVSDKQFNRTEIVTCVSALKLLWQNGGPASVNIIDTPVEFYSFPTPLIRKDGRSGFGKKRAVTAFFQTYSAGTGLPGEREQPGGVFPADFFDELFGKLHLPQRPQRVGLREPGRVGAVEQLVRVVV